MRKLAILLVATAAATALGVDRLRSTDHPGETVDPGGSLIPALTSGSDVHVTGLYQARIDQANRPGCCDWVPMVTHDGDALEVQFATDVAALAVIEFTGALRVGAPDRFLEQVHAAIEVDGVVDEHGEVVARVAGVDPVFSSIENWEQVAGRLVAFLVPREHTIRVVWRDTNGTTASQANHMTLVVTVYTASNACPGDANGDGTIDFEDLLIVLDGWGACPD